jgi:DNA-binding PadR family transcriptional regulator
MPSRKKSDESEFLPTTYLTVLTLIGRGARYGYEINSLIEKHGYREWVDMRFSTVYKALNELEDRGLVKGAKEDPAKKTSRKTYTLTRKGRRKLKNQIYMCLSAPPRAKTVFDLGLSAMSMLTKAEVLMALKEYKTNLENSLSFLSAQIDGLKNLERYKMEEPDRTVGSSKVTEFDGAEEIEVVLALFERPARTVQTQLKWLNEFTQLVDIGKGFKFKPEK